MDSGNTSWVLVSAALVMLMTPGLALFYGGMVRAKNVLAMLMQNFFALGLVSAVWALLAFSLAFGTDFKGIIGGLDFVGLKGLFSTEALPGYTGAFALSIPPAAFFAFQMMFAIITPALVSGATADRLKFSAWALFLALWTVLCYAPVAHWVFNPAGWLAKLGALDFAGGTVVHVNAGIAALALAFVLGRRRSWPREAMPPHSLPLTLLGTGLLWFGWIGFNAGSALSAGKLAAQALVTTHLAAATGVLGWLAVERWQRGRATTLGAASGAVAGLVAITPCAGFVGGGAALVIGAIAGIACALAVALKFRLGLDDALDVVGVHLVGGVLGSLLLGVFADKSVNPLGADGLLYGGGFRLLAVQALAVGAVLAFTGVMTLGLGWAIHRLWGLRVDEESERIGLDQTQHAETAYALFESAALTREAPPVPSGAEKAEEEAPALSAASSPPRAPA
ncbi:MAG: ammonium transporter [Deltaproteobacteria bacterium]|nr:ammonium transporter [Deltaproteobacteria bacterium]